MNRLLLLIALSLIVFLTNAQQNQNDLSRADTVDYSEVINKFLNENIQKNIDDSIFSESFTYLDKFLNSDTTQKNFSIVQELVSTNKLIIEILKLYQFRHKVDSLNNIRYKVLSDYWELEQLKEVARKNDSIDSLRYEVLNDSVNIEMQVNIYDSSSIIADDTTSLNLSDSIFFEELEKVTYQDTLNLDSILHVLNPYNDTLLRAIDEAILSFREDNMVNWIKDIRNDTINLYLVDIEGDSLLVQLYDNSPYLIRFGLTDYWGTRIPAVIRDVERRSFRILIDDAPEVFYQTDEKAKSAISSINEKISSPDTLSIKPLPVVIVKPRWMFGGDFKLDLSQVGMYQWAQGGDPFVSFLGGLNLFANYKEGRRGWENRALLRYGVIRQGRLDNDPSAHIRSNEDRMELSSRYGYNAFGQFYLSIEADSKTQIGPTYDWDGDTRGDLKTNFMSPAFLAFSLGLDYKPDKKTTLFLAPITIKSTIVLDPSSEIKKRYSVDTTKNSREEFGARFKGTHSLKIWDDIEIKNTLELFSNYLDNPQNIDINWEFTTVFPVNDFIKATLSFNLIYDDDTEVPKYTVNNAGESVKYNGKGLQVKEMLTLGFYMKF